MSLSLGQLLDIESDHLTVTYEIDYTEADVADFMTLKYDESIHNVTVLVDSGRAKNGIYPLDIKVVETTLSDGTRKDMRKFETSLIITGLEEAQDDKESLDVNQVLT